MIKNIMQSSRYLYWFVDYSMRARKCFLKSFSAIALIFIIILSGCEKYHVFNKKPNNVDNDINTIYDNIVEKINKNDIPLEFAGGYSKYVGYQFYDRNLDGINELYIYRIHDFLNSNNGMASKPFIYEAYKVEDHKPVLFFSGEPRGVSTHDNCYFALVENRIAYLTSGYSEENIIVYDNQNNEIEKIHCDYAFVTGNPDHDVYKINETTVSKNEYRKKIESINNNIGFFPIKLNE